jgi:hypothetical protein
MSLEFLEQDSRIENVKLHFYQKDILTDSLDDVSFPEKIDGLVYAPGSINLKPFGRLSEEDFKKILKLMFWVLLKTFRNYCLILKNLKVQVWFYSAPCAAKLGMPFHSSIAASKVL